MNAVTLLWVMGGGAVGALGRYGITVALAQMSQGFPLGTLLVNLGGTFLLGILGAYGEIGLAPSWVRAGIMSGLIGAFTTFSTFQWEVLALIRQHEVGTAFLYVGTSIVFGLVCIGLGFAVGYLWLQR
ncbi:MAG: CrcB family protein [Bacillota bacterium]|nr:CrcB family protein [Bacillota bacterium]